MKKLTPTDVRALLDQSIDSIRDQREKYLVNPRTDFTRTQKISFRETMIFPMVIGNQLSTSELVDFFPETKIPSLAAMSYRRDQIRPEAFAALFSEFTSKIPRPNKHLGMHIIAVDGSRVNTPYNPKDPETYSQCIAGRRGINQLHLNALYDILNDTFLDVVVQNGKSANEQAAFCSMIDRYHEPGTALFIADRGYATFNVLAHILHQKQHFLIRIKQNMAETLFTDTDEMRLSTHWDQTDTIRIGRRLTCKTKKLTNYHCISRQRTFDYLPEKSSEVYSFEVRLLKFPISETDYEYILTDLSPKQCTLEEVKGLYHLRWGIETAFRFLKYSANLLHVHSLKHTFLLQEIYAKLTFYNFSAAILSNQTGQVKEGKKHQTKINKTNLFEMVLRFLKGKIHNLEELISKKRVSDRPNRAYKRNMRTQQADTLNYR